MTRGFVDGEYQDGEIRGINFLVGRRGFGKTTLMAKLLGTCTGGRIFFDTLSKHGPVLPDYVPIYEHGNLLSYLRPNRGRQFKVLYQPRRGNLDQHFDAVCRIVYAFGWMIFAVDELDKLCGVRFGESRMPEPFYNLVNYGRHPRVSMIATARRPQGVATGFRDEAEYRVFSLKGKGALEAIANDIGAENIPRVVGLPKFSYLHCKQDEDPALCGPDHVIT